MLCPVARVIIIIIVMVKEQINSGHMLVNLKMIERMGMVNKNFITEINTKVDGQIIIFMDTGLIYLVRQDLLQAKDTKVNIKKGLRHGFGTNEDSMGKYWGQFLNGLKHGQGIYYLSDGSKFVGDFNRMMNRWDHSELILTAKKYKVFLTSKLLNQEILHLNLVRNR